MGLSVERSAIVIARFPFTDLSYTTVRPAVVLSGVGRHDWILGQITRNADIDNLAVELTNDSLAQGSLRNVSYFRPNKLFTGNQILITGVAARLKPEVFNKLLNAVTNILNQSRMR